MISTNALNLSQVKAIAEKSIPFVQRSGLQVLAAKPGYAQCKMPLRDNENHMQSMYAGAQFTLADITGGVLALASFDTQRFYPTLKDLQMRFLKPAQTDLTCTMSIPLSELQALIHLADENDKAAFVLQGDLRAMNGDIIATATGEFQVRAKNPR